MATNLLTNPELLHEASDDKHRVYYYTTHDPDQHRYVTNARHQLVRPEGWELWVEHAEEARHAWDARWRRWH